MSDRSCQNCMIFKQGECLGKGLCESYKPAPVADPKEFWPASMRSRSSYAGSRKNDYDWVYESKPKKNNEAPKEAEYVRELDYHLEKYNNPGSIEKLLRFLNGKVIAWISFESYQVASGIRYKASCLLQYRENVLGVKTDTPQKWIERAMLDGLHEIAEHITKPGTVYVVTDRILFDKTAKNDDLRQRAVLTLRNKGCRITEILVKGSTELIHEQVCSRVIMKNDKDEVPVVVDVEQSEVEAHEVNNTPENNTNNKDLDKRTEIITQEDADKLMDAMNSKFEKESESTKEKPHKPKKAKPQNKSVGQTKSEEGITIQCRVCGRRFTMSASELDFFKKKKFQLPQRCTECIAKGVRYSDADYYDRGLKHNSYQRNLNMYGPRINVNGGLENSPGFKLEENENGMSTYTRKFAGKTEVYKKRHL